jgi:hypothetical protein
MGESLIQRCRVSDEGSFGCKTLSLGKIMTVLKEEAPANSVPAAAVIRGGLVLFILIGRKGHVGGSLSYK